MPRKFLVVTLIAFAIASTILLVLRETPRFEFVNWDDATYVLKNPHVRDLNLNTFGWMFTHAYFNSYIPVTLLSHAIDVALWGQKPAGHHITSAILHACNGALMFLLAVAFLDKRALHHPRHAPTYVIIMSAVAAALIFALHPLRMESAAWVSGRKDLLATFFMLSATLFYVHDHDKLWTRGAAIVLFVLSVLSKPSGIFLPFALLALDLAIVPMNKWHKEWKQSARRLWPFLIVMVADAAAVAVAAPHGESSTMTGENTFPLLYPLYPPMFLLWKTIVPLALAPLYSPATSAVVVIAFIAFIAVTMLSLVLAWKRRPGVMLAWFCFLALMAPVVFGLGSGIQPVADRYVYMPSIALALLLAGGIASVASNRSWNLSSPLRMTMAGGVVVIILALALLSVRQAGIWKNSGALWRYAEQVSPDNVITLNNMGTVYSAEGRRDSALMTFRRALVIAPDHPEALYNLADELSARGVLDSAYLLYTRALAIRPAYADAWMNRAIVLVKTSRFREALDDFGHAGALEPDAPDVPFGAGYAYNGMGDTTAALAMFQRAAVLDPGFADAHLNAGVLLAKAGRRAEAREALTRAAGLGSREAAEMLRTLRP